jgi:hypothetical protein
MLGLCSARAGGIVTEERSEEQRRAAAQQPGPSTEQEIPEQQKSPPYNFRIAAIALILAAFAFALSMFIFGGLFKEATEVTTALGTLFTLMGSVVGAYFGIKASNDAADKAQGEIKAANKSAKAAFGELDPQQARDLLDKGY